MKTYKVKDQEEAVKNAKLFYETVKLAWGFQVTYCYHDLIHLIKNDLCYDLYDSDVMIWKNSRVPNFFISINQIHLLLLRFMESGLRIVEL